MAGNIFHSQNSKEDFIQDYCNRRIAKGESIGLSSECSKDSWGLTAKEQSEEVHGDIEGRGILAKERPRMYTSMVGNEKLDQISRVGG